MLTASERELLMGSIIREKTDFAVVNNRRLENDFVKRCLFGLKDLS